MLLMKTGKLALCGMLTAVSVILLFIGSLFSTLNLSAAAFAGIIVLVAAIEAGIRYSICVYACVSLLSLILLPNKSAAVFYIFFGGMYPMLKWQIEKISNKYLIVAVKLMYVNTVFVIIYFVGKYLFIAEAAELSFGIPLLVLTDICFFLFDYALKQILLKYRNVFRKKH